MPSSELFVHFFFFSNLNIRSPFINEARNRKAALLLAINLE